MPDEAKPLSPSAERVGVPTAAKPDQKADQAAAPAGVPGKTGKTGPSSTGTPEGKTAEQPRPKPPAGKSPAPAPAAPAPAVPPTPPVVRPAAGQPARSGSSNRVRARLARLGVQRSNPYNPFSSRCCG